MGIVNVTPDSFSDGGLFLQADAAIEHARLLAAEGADILDVGGESTRPGAEPVPAEEELRRVLPVVAGIAAADTGAKISVDTSKASVARAALDAGASLVNDVSAFRADPQMAGLVAESGAECCLMHMLGEPRLLQHGPRYEDVVDDVKAFLAERLAFASAEGVSERRVLLDPGIGFGKTVEHNLQLLSRLDELTTLGCPIVIGTSRKSFLARITASLAAGRGQTAGPDRVVGARHMHVAGARDRLAATLASNVLAYERGARVFRVHEVAPVRQALAVAAATLGERWTAKSTGTRQTS